MSIRREDMHISAFIVLCAYSFEAAREIYALAFLPTGYANPFFPPFTLFLGIVVVLGFGIVRPLIRWGIYEKGWFSILLSPLRGLDVFVRNGVSAHPMRSFITEGLIEKRGEGRRRYSQFPKEIDSVFLKRLAQKVWPNGIYRARYRDAVELTEELVRLAVKLEAENEEMYNRLNTHAKLVGGIPEVLEAGDELGWGRDDVQVAFLKELASKHGLELHERE